MKNITSAYFLNYPYAYTHIPIHRVGLDLLSTFVLSLACYYSGRH